MSPNKMIVPKHLNKIINIVYDSKYLPRRKSLKILRNVIGHIIGIYTPIAALYIYLY